MIESCRFRAASVLKRSGPPINAGGSAAPTARGAWRGASRKTHRDVVSSSRTDVIAIVSASAERTPVHICLLNFRGNRWVTRSPSSNITQSSLSYPIRWPRLGIPFSRSVSQSVFWRAKVGASGVQRRPFGIRCIFRSHSFRAWPPGFHCFQKASHGLLGARRL